MILSIAVGVATGILSGFGIGGGSLLMLYLTVLAGVLQRAAAGLNLIYFIACAPAALYSHTKNKLIDGRAVLWCTLAGVPVSVAAAMLAGSIDTSLLRRLFGVFLLYIGVRELLAKQPKSEKGLEK